MMMRLLLSSLLVAQAAAGSLDASAEPAATALERVRASDQDRELSLTPVGRLRLSYPQRVSGSIGAILSRQPVGQECTTSCELRGLLFQAEPGFAGGQMSAGYAVIIGGRNQNERFLSQVYMAYGIKAALLRTWHGSSLDPEDQSLLGVEGAFSIVNLNFSLGAFRHVGSGDPDDLWLVSGGVGWGF